MVSSERPPRPLRNALLALLTFFVLDAALFRSGLYAMVQAPQSPAGSFFYGVFFERHRAADPNRDIIVFGNSKIEVGFDALAHQQQHPEDSYRWFNGASSSSTMRWWYYKLQFIDPHRDRYKAVVIPINGYLVRPVAHDPGDDFRLAVALNPLLNLDQWGSLISSIEDPDAQFKTELLAAFPSHGYASDIMDFISHAPIRIARVALRYWQGAYSKPYAGLGDENMSALKLDPATGRVLQWPAHFDSFAKDEFLKQMKPQGDQQKLAQRYIDYDVKWLQAIIDYYRGSKTKVVILPVPAYAMKFPGVAPLPNAPDVRNLLDPSSNVIFLDDKTYQRFETLSYFHDSLHLDSSGRRDFTDALTQDVENVLATFGASH